MDIDRLDIVISAEARKAEKQLNKLISALGNLSSALGGLNVSGLTGLANSVQSLSAAMQGMNAVRTTDFTRLARNIQRLAGIDARSLNSAASSMNIIGKSISGLGVASANAQAIGEMAKNLSKLGNKSIQNAIANMPKLASSLSSMMRTLQSAPRVSNNLIRMTEAMGKLASNGNRVGGAARSLNNGFKSYGNYTDTATKKTRSFASAIGMLYAKFWILQRALKGLFSAIEKSMDFSETVNYFEVAMRKIGDDASRKWQESGYDSAEAYSESFSKRLKELTAKMTGFEIDSDGNAILTNQKSLGLDPDKVLQYQAQYAQMADSIGMTEEAALNTSKALTMLGTDWASLRNISFDQAWEKFASALAGQSRAVRSLGIDITQATLQEYAYKYGLETAVSEMNQATKAQLRLLAILDQSKVAFGDLANTIQSPANQLRLLQQNFSNLARIIGNIFLPVIAKALPYINGIVIALQRLFQLIAKLLGVNMKNINTSIGGMSDSFSDLVDEGNIDGITGSADGASDAIDKANESAKKFKNTILGFDELNTLNDNSFDNSGYSGNNSAGSLTPSIGGSGILDSAIADALSEYEKAWNDAFNRMENKANDFADKVESAFKKIWKVAKPTREALKKLWNEGISKLGDFTWTSLKDFYGEFLVPVGRWTLGSGLPKFINITNNFLNNINWPRINASLKDFWKALAPFATNIGEGLIEFYNDLSSVGADFINNVVPGGLDSLASALKKISPETAQKIGYGLGILFASISAFKGITWIGNILGTGGPLAKGLSSLASHPYASLAVGISGVVVALDKFGIIDVDWDWLWRKIGQIKDILSEFIDKIDFQTLYSSIGNLWDAFQPFAQGFADGFINAFDVILNDIGAPLINAFAGALEVLAEVLSNIPPEAWEAVGKALGTIVAVKLTKDFILNTLKLSKAFSALKQVISGGDLARSIDTLSGSIGNLMKNETIRKIGESTESATSSMKGFKEILAGLGLGAAIIGISEGAIAISEFSDSAKGGNGEISELGGAIDNMIISMKDSMLITNDQKESLFQLKEQIEDNKGGVIEYSTAFVQALSECGISSDEAREAIDRFAEHTSLSEDQVSMLKGIIEGLGDSATQMSGKISLAGIGAEEAFGGMRDAVQKLIEEGFLNEEAAISSVNSLLEDQEFAAMKPQAQWDALCERLQKFGIDAGTASKILSVVLPGAIKTMEDQTSSSLQATKEEFETSTKGMKTSVDTNIVGASKTIEEESANIEKNVTDAMSVSGKVVSDTMGDVDYDTDKAWGNSSGYTSESIKSMKNETSKGMQQVFKNVESYMTSIYNTITNKFKWAGDMTNILLENMSGDVGKGLSGVNSVVKQHVDSIGYSFYNLTVRIRDSLGGMYGIGRNAAQSFANGISSVHIPMPHISVTSSAYSNGSGYSYNMHSSVSWYAMGGFPNVGELFIANENGPEMLGKMGNRNVVANNKQITDGIKAAVVEGMMEVVMANRSGQSDDKPYIIDVTVKTQDNEVLARAVEKGRMKRDMRFNPSPSY